MPEVVKSECREMILKMKKFCDAEIKRLFKTIKNMRVKAAAMTGKF